jgi:hypothetical protein
VRGISYDLDEVDLHQFTIAVSFPCSLRNQIQRFTWESHLAGRAGSLNGIGDERL